MAKKTNAITGIGAIQKTKFLPPYVNGKTTFAEAKNKSGVYLIKEDGVIVYIGYSSNNLYRTLYRHFQDWNHTSQQVITYKGKDLDRYTVRIIYCTPLQAERLEAYLIQKMEPRDNYMKMKSYADDNNAEKVYQSYKVAELVDTDMPF